MASFSDDFNRADSSNLGAGWVEVSGDWSIISGQLSPGAAGGTIILRAATAMDSSDHYAQVTIAATTAASQGVWARGNSNISQGYLWRNNGSSWDLFSVVGGSFTVIGTYAAAAAPGDIAKVQAVGSTITAYVNGVQRVSVVNAAVTTGTSVGIRSDSAGALRYDDFTAADITAGVTLPIASSIEAGQPLTGTKAALLATAAESDGAQPLAGVKTTALSPASEQDTALALGGTKVAALDVAATVEAAQPLTGGKAAALTPAVEQNTAQALGGVKTSTLAAAGTVETALPLVGTKSAVLPIALEVDTARPLTIPSVGSTAPSPERTYRIPAERRRLAVPAEHRTLTVRR
ncbi:hypothetical protein GCM10018980_52140 [Streptomyces capoamus]|uniref:Uncharacterized protein n=1 Tax=Streptomyces capoamus TaxID=68183 RepID=A0A919EZC3_9ACTN|nr:hypothetical protein [Streptomyces capoamus]GGW15706.1 hypothetical protein GCM10010501_28690 [Streptomyces libani subsp. rufus]GHG62291.1 hypothetical protein GCM10018980_52140 [Streptomyces capoamus]